MAKLPELQPCGLTYDEFRAGWTYADAYEWIAWQEGRKGISQRQVVRELRKQKQAEYERYLEACGDATPDRLRAGCTRICRRGQPCGESCIAVRYVCRQPETTACAFDDVVVAPPSTGETIEVDPAEFRDDEFTDADFAFWDEDDADDVPF